MSTQYYCKKARRRAEVAAAVDASGNPVLNGIDYLEVTSTDEKTLSVHFLFNLPGSANPVPPSATPLIAGNFVIEGGVRIRGIQVQSVSTSSNVLTVQVVEAGDFSTYTLRLVTNVSNLTTPAGFDPQLSAVDFSFKVACPSNFDCKPDNECPPTNLPEPDIDYLAKDYGSFRRLILDRLTRNVPDWRERNPADVGIAVVELLAYAGDQLSYYQDAVATEAYLGTARRRVSVRRHARLVDYFIHDGVNARTWVFLNTQTAVLAPLGTVLLTKSTAPRGILSEAVAQAALARGSQAFETLFAITVHPELNQIRFYTWSDEQCCLPMGATRATLRDEGAGPRLRAGDLLLFEEVVSPATLAAADADPAHRSIVRLTEVVSGVDPLDNTSILEIAWDAKDALPFALCLSNGTPDLSIARGNIVLVDEGLTQPKELLEDIDTTYGPYRPQLKNPGLTFRVPYDDTVSRQLPAYGLPIQSASDALPAITLKEGSTTWTPRRDLLSSAGNAPDFVVEMENDGTATLRFGDGIMGSNPVSGLEAIYRTGNGSAGNVGSEAIAHVLGTPSVPLTGIVDVRNPLPARGGVDAEGLERVRLFAPTAFRTQKRAVTEADYATVTERQAEVKKAQATLRWTGSWYTMFVIVDRIDGLPVDDAFRARIQNFLDQYRLAGYDLQIEAPAYVSLDIAFTICVAQGYFRSAVQNALLATFSNQDLPDGQRGFFHPDNFTFGQPVYLSQVIAAAMQVPGVRWVDTNDVPPAPNRFHRWGQSPQGEIEAGRIPMARLEIARLDNDRSQPENGKIEFIMEGGI